MLFIPYALSKRRFDTAIRGLLQQDLSCKDFLRSETSAICKSYYDSASADLRDYFFRTGNGSQSAEYHSKIVDILLLRLLKVANEAFGRGDIGFSLLAVGGYGRCELAPYSDIDIVFLWHRKASASTLRIMDFILYRLWDLGLQVGHSGRSLEQNLRLAKKDHTVATALLESRFIAGDRKLYGEFKRRFRREIMGGEAHQFALQKLDERDARHIRMGDTRYVLEPNIKEGKGGLRDLQLMRWVALSFYHLKDVSEFYGLGIFTESDYRAFERAVNFFMALRFHLHYQASRASELLTFDAQMQIAESMHYRDNQDIRAVERLMRSYFLHATDVAELTRILATDLRQKINKNESGEVEKIGDFLMQVGRLNVPNLDIFSGSPIKILEFFDLGLRYNLDFHPDAFRSIRKAFDEIYILRNDNKAYELFLQILTARQGQERILRLLGESGFLGRFLLDFGKVQAQMQYDMYHVYTTDEHTIRAIGNLNSIEQGKSQEAHPLAHAEIHKTNNRLALYMAVFLHDIAKGQKGDHSELGAELALRLCPKFGFDEEKCELISWLVKYHLLMSNTAFKRNLDDPKTISDFVKIVRTSERLRLLLCLTVADITAVGPKVWNEWKAHLIRVLFRRAIAHMTADMSDGEALEADLKGHQSQLWELMGDQFSDDDKKRFLSIASPSYYLSYTPEELLQHAKFILTASDTAIEISTDSDHAVVNLLIYVDDSDGLMAKMCGSIALCSFNIVEARTNTLEAGKTLCIFTLQNKEASSDFDDGDLERLRSALDISLSGSFNAEALEQSLAAAQFGGYSDRRAIFSVTPHISISNQASLEHTMIEVKATDCLGLVFALSHSLHQQGLSISYARIATFGEQAHDVFYVQSSEREQITDEGALSSIHSELLQALRKSGSFSI